MVQYKSYSRFLVMVKYGRGTICEYVNTRKALNIIGFSL